MATKSTWHSLEKLKKGHLLHKCSLLSGRTFYLHWVQTLFPVSYWFLISQIILLSPHKIYLLRGREGRAVRGSRTSQWETEWEREKRGEEEAKREWSLSSLVHSLKDFKQKTCKVSHMRVGDSIMGASAAASWALYQQEDGGRCQLLWNSGVGCGLLTSFMLTATIPFPCVYLI